MVNKEKAIQEKNYKQEYKIINNILQIGLGFLFLFFLIRGEVYSFSVIFLMICIISLFVLLFKPKQKELFWFIMLVYLALLGEHFLLGLYEEFIYYDKILHFFAFVIISQFIFVRLKNFGLRKKIFFFTFFICLGIGTFWEIIEYLMDLIVRSDCGRLMQGAIDSNIHSFLVAIDDTMIDLIAGSFGSIIGLIFQKFGFSRDL